MKDDTAEALVGDGPGPRSCHLLALAPISLAIAGSVFAMLVCSSPIRCPYGDRGSHTGLTAARSMREGMARAGIANGTSMHAPAT
jgi:hypothetical protein